VGSTLTGQGIFEGKEHTEATWLLGGGRWTCDREIAGLTPGQCIAG